MRDTELLTTEFRPLRWSIRDLWPEGAITVAGKRKGGKSWYTLAAAYCIAAGLTFLNRYTTEPGDVLYLGLEDSQRRLKKRLATIMHAFGNKTASGRLHMYGRGEWPEGDSGLDKIKEWLKDFPNAKAVIIDPMADIAIVPNNYSAARTLGRKLSEIGEQFGVSVVAVLHMGKASLPRTSSTGMDWQDRLLGSTGWPSAMDAIYGLFRDDKLGLSVLMGTGKDVESTETELTFEDGLWSVKGQTDNCGRTAPEMSLERARIVAAVETTETGMKAQEIADAFYGGTYDSAYKILADMRTAGQITRRQGMYLTAAMVERLENPPQSVEQASLTDIPTVDTERKRANAWDG